MNPAELAVQFRHAIGLNAQAWAAFAREHLATPSSLDDEQANLSKAAWQAMQEPIAWPSGLELLDVLWPYIELSGKWRQWHDLLERALSVSREAGRRSEEAHLLLRLGELDRILGDTSLALARQQAALELWRELGDQAGMGYALVTISQVQLSVGDQAQAERCCREGLAILQELNAPGDLAVAHNNLGIICQTRKGLDEAMAEYEQAARLFSATGNVRGQAKVANNQGRVVHSQARRDEAAAFYRRAIELYRQVGDDVHAARSEVNLGIVLYELGQVDEALALHRQVEPALRRLGDRPWVARVVNNQGVFLQAKGQVVEAQAAYDQAAAIYREIGELPSEAQTLVNCADLLMDFGRLAEARSYLRQAYALIQRLPSPVEWLAAAYDRQMVRWQGLAWTEHDDGGASRPNPLGTQPPQ